MTNLVQFPGLGLSFEIDRVAFTIGGVSIYWYGVCIAVGLCLALVFAFRHSIEFGVDPDGMVDVILIGVVLGIVSARAYYVAMAPFKYQSIWEMIAIRDGGLAIYGGIIGGFLFGGPHGRPALWPVCRPCPCPFYRRRLRRPARAVLPGCTPLRQAGYGACPP